MIVGGLLITGAFIVYLASYSCNRYVQKRSLKFYKLKWNSMIV